jgi:hypothetical protein
MREKHRNACRVEVGKPEERIPFGRNRIRCSIILKFILSNTVASCGLD